MNYCRFNVLVLESAGWAGGRPDSRQDIHPCLPHCTVCSRQGWGRDLSTPYSVCVHVAPRSCTSDTSTAALWELREAERSHSLYLRLPHGPNLDHATTMCLLFLNFNFN